MKVDEEFTDQSIEEIAEGGVSLVRALNEPELPENSPRYVVLSYELVREYLQQWQQSTNEQKHKDGRVSYPLLLVNW